MSGQFYRYNRETREMEPIQRETAGDAGNGLHFVQGDTLPYALENPVTGEMSDSKSFHRAIYKACGVQELGNDLISKQPRRVPDVQTFPMESIERDLWRKL